MFIKEVKRKACVFPCIIKYKPGVWGYLLYIGFIYLSLVLFFWIYFKSRDGVLQNTIDHLSADQEGLGKSNSTNTLFLSAEKDNLHISDPIVRK